MTQPAKSHEPSMEEILASIRRIIADDDSHRPTPSVAEAAASMAVPAAAPATATEPNPAEASDTAATEESATVAADSIPKSTTANDDPSADILELTESMAASRPAEPAPAPPSHSVAAPLAEFRTIDGESDVSFAETIEKSPPRSGLVEPPPLLSRATSAAVDSALNTLAQTVLVQNARTLEDLVREMLRPLLKSWLDENLPSLVERLVRAEIERVSRGR